MVRTHRIIRGDSLNPHFRLVYADGQTPVDLTGCTVQLVARDSQSNIVINASTSNGKITLNPTNGDVFVNIPPADTLNVQPGSYKLRLRVIFPNNVERTLLDTQLIVKEL